MHSVIEAACRQGVEVFVVDFDPGVDSGRAISIMDVARGLGAHYARSGAFESTLATLAGELKARAAAQDYDAAQQLLILHGIDRASSLAPQDPYAASDDPPTAGSMLAGVIQHGPDLGLHTVVWADRMASVIEHLGSDSLREFAFRLAGSSTDRDDVGVVLPTYGTPPTLERGQLFVGDHFARLAKRIRGYEAITTVPTN